MLAGVEFLLYLEINLEIAKLRQANSYYQMKRQLESITPSQAAESFFEWMKGGGSCPDEVLACIFGYLSPKDYFRTLAASKQFKPLELVSQR